MGSTSKRRGSEEGTGRDRREGKGVGDGTGEGRKESEWKGRVEKGRVPALLLVHFKALANTKNAFEM